MAATAFSGLDFLATAVMLLDSNLRVQYANPAAESLFEFSGRNILGSPVARVFQDGGRLMRAIDQALEEGVTRIEHDLPLGTPGHGKLHLSASVTPLELEGIRMLLEFQPIDQQLRIAREERMLDQSQATRTLIRNLAHEIKNPLGGIRGAAQLLERELESPALKEYTQVITQEAGRLQSLMDRMLTPHRLPQPAQINIHEVLERVRAVVLAENHEGLSILQDYDVSLPTLFADKEQLIQAALNVVRNAAQALGGRGRIILRTRVARQVTLAKRRHRHAIQVQIVDNGPGVPETIRDRIFDPLVSGREGGHGLGLTLAQAFVNQHGGIIEYESVPGNTCFTLLLPLRSPEQAGTMRDAP